MQRTEVLCEPAHQGGLSGQQTPAHTGALTHAEGCLYGQYVLLGLPIPECRGTRSKSWQSVHRHHSARDLSNSSWQSSLFLGAVSFQLSVDSHVHATLIFNVKRHISVVISSFSVCFPLASLHLGWNVRVRISHPHVPWAPILL